MSTKFPFLNFNQIILLSLKNLHYEAFFATLWIIIVTGT
jgi:hypothetical protein